MVRVMVFGAALAVLILTAAPAAPPARADDVAPAGEKGDMLTWFKDAESKLAQLAEAMPAGKYAWRPGKGVRSPAEVFMHVAAANYGLPLFAGVKPPEGFKIETYERSLTKKADIVRALKNSFEHLNQALMNTSDEELDRRITFFGREQTVRSMYLLLLSHNHEHLGQSIAYARVNGIVPPWTLAAEKKAAETRKTAEANQSSQ